MKRKRYAYHLTLQSNLLSICQSGLKPGIGGIHPGILWISREVIYKPDLKTGTALLRFPWPTDAKMVVFDKSLIGREFITRKYVTCRKIQILEGRKWISLWKFMSHRS